MTLEEIFYLSQSIASVAVVGTLIYLGLQVRYAERSQRAIMQQGRADRVSQASLTVASPELARVWQIGVSPDPQLTREEFAQFMLIMRSAFLSGEDSFLQYRAGTLDKAAFDSYAAGVTHYMRAPGMRAAWKLSAPQFGPEFRAFGDAQVAQASREPYVDPYDIWKTTLQAELLASAD
jgi:hypothetical protein